MDWIVDFFIPLVKAIFIIGTIGGILAYLSYKFYVAWKKNLKYFFKYLFKPFPVEILDLCFEFESHKLSYFDVKKQLLLSEQDNEYVGIQDNYIDEILYIYKKILKESKREVKNKWQQTQKSNKQ